MKRKRKRWRWVSQPCRCLPRPTPQESLTPPVCSTCKCLGWGNILWNQENQTGNSNPACQMSYTLILWGKKRMRRHQSLGLNEESKLGDKRAWGNPCHLQLRPRLTCLGRCHPTGTQGAWAQDTRYGPPEVSCPLQPPAFGPLHTWLREV